MTTKMHVKKIIRKNILLILGWSFIKTEEN